jgi:cysteine-rich repeat protein
MSSTTTASSTGTDPSTTTDAPIPPNCGDGSIDDGEECDEGSGNDDTGACTAACRNATCGDGLVWNGQEACDDGNADDSDGCTTLCAPPACDDEIQSGDETDVDCGGSCDACVSGQACLIPADCADGACSDGLCAPAASCAELLANFPSSPDGLYAIDPNGGEATDAVTVFCDMSTDGGGWTALAANGDIEVPETIDPDDCYPWVSPDAGCGDSSDLMGDFSVAGAQQAALSWSRMMGVAYSDMGYDDKLAFFAIDFGGSQPTADERFNGTPYVPAGITTTYGEMGCAPDRIAHYGTGGRYNPDANDIASGKGTIFGHDNVVTMNDSGRGTFGFTDARDSSATTQGTGIDDYQDGWACSDVWVPLEVRGERMVVLVR